MSGGHCTLPTGGPAIRLKNKKKMRPRRPKQCCLQSVSTASSTPVCTPSLSTSASLTTSPASTSSKKDDPGPTAFPESVTDQTTARAYFKKVMTKQISACDAKLFENWSRTNTNHFSDWSIESYSVPSQYKNIVMELAKHLGYEYKMKYFGT